MISFNAQGGFHAGLDSSLRSEQQSRCGLESSYHIPNGIEPRLPKRF